WRLAHPRLSARALAEGRPVRRVLPLWEFAVLRPADRAANIRLYFVCLLGRRRRLCRLCIGRPTRPAASRLVPLVVVEHLPVAGADPAEVTAVVEALDGEVRPVRASLVRYPRSAM